MKAFQAYSTGGFKATAETARKAADKFFADFPTKRKCNVIEGKVDGHFFTVTYGQRSKGEWPMSFKDVTKKTVSTLPDVSEIIR